MADDYPSFSSRSSARPGQASVRGKSGGVFDLRAARVEAGMPTDDQLKAIMPALPAPKRQALLPFLEQAIEEFGIAGAPRQAAFLAQLAHESGQFRFMEEIWGPTDTQVRYEPVSSLATRLGNTERGDGKRFKGRGPIQLTGRANYGVFGTALGIDLLADPPRAATPALAFRVAGLFWQRKGLNELADLATATAFKEITRRINGGFNGLGERERFYAVARQVLGVAEGAAPVTGALEPPAGVRGLGAGPPTPARFERGAEAIRRHDAAERARARRARAARASKSTSKAASRTAKTSKRAGAASKKRAAKASKRRAATPPRRSVKKR